MDTSNIFSDVSDVPSLTDVSGPARAVANKCLLSSCWPPKIVLVDQSKTRLLL